MYYLAAVGGALLWIVTSAVSDRSEAWDSPAYWAVTYPLSIALAGVLGYIEPSRAWRWGFVTVVVQLPVMMLTSGNSWSLLPLVAALFCVLSLPAIVAAVTCARLRSRRNA